MNDTSFSLLGLLDVEQIEDNLFRGHSPHGRARRVFGGQVIAQALAAACRTVEGMKPHSLHAYFILAGDPSVPIAYEVGRVRDGRSFATRRVTANQHGKTIYSMIASFHVDEEGTEHQIAMPDVPMPEEIDFARTLAEFESQLPRPLLRFLADNGAVDIRPVHAERYLGEKREDGRYAVWMKTRDALPDDPALHRIALAYASDMAFLDVILTRTGHTIFSADVMGVSLDHALWFHRPFRADEWFLYAQDSPSAYGGRGLARGSIFSRDGTLIASSAQEGLFRLREASPPKAN